MRSFTVFLNLATVFLLFRSTRLCFEGKDNPFFSILICVYSSVENVRRNLCFSHNNLIGEILSKLKFFFKIQNLFIFSRYFYKNYVFILPTIDWIFWIPNVMIYWLLVKLDSRNVSVYLLFYWDHELVTVRQPPETLGLGVVGLGCLTFYIIGSRPSVLKTRHAHLRRKVLGSIRGSRVMNVRFQAVLY